MTSFYQYNYSFLLQDHWVFTAYFLLLLNFFVLYTVKSHFMRGIFFFLALLFALYSGTVTWLGLGVISFLGGLFYYAFEGKKQIYSRLAFAGIILMAATLVILKTVPGIQNWQVASNILLSSDALPFSMWFTFDKSLIGLFFIWLSTYSLANGGKWKPVLKQGFLMGLAAIVVLIPASIALGYVKYDLKWTNFFFLFAVHNLFFVCIVEEALFRGLIQNGLMMRLQGFTWGKWLALALTAVIFGAVHFQGGLAYVGLATLAGLFYGYVFLKTKKLEASVLTHFMVNIVHFIAFTYPALNPSL